MSRAWLLLCFLVGCVSSGDVNCPDGRICPEGKVCAVAAGTPYCVDASQLGCTDGEPCGNGGSTCHDGVCLPSECGNGVIDLGEVCDDGNTVDADGCSKTCLSNEVCGNQVVDAIVGEQCDDGLPGLSGDGCASTCEVEALVWREVTPRGLTPRTYTAMAYDSLRQRVVLFGGLTANALESDTWVFVDNSWRQLITGPGPSGRVQHGLVYDAQRDEIVLFGGIGAAANGDTWVFDGTTWTQRTPPASPPARSNVSMAYHATRHEIVLFGGLRGAAALGDTWVWNGTTWTQQSGTSPPADLQGVMAYDDARGEVVYFASGATWTWNGTWTQKSPATPPPFQYADSMTYSPGLGKIVMYALVNRTYTWNGSDWTFVSGAGGPPRNDGVALAYNGQSDRVILFGGDDQGAPLILFGETWDFSGTAWSLVATNPPSPPPRAGHAMAYDSRRGEIVMFGGQPDNTTLSMQDTWRWSNGAWTAVPPNTILPPRALHAMAYDVKRDRIVMFGGYNRGYFEPSGSTTTDTWEWDGTDWLERVVIGPPARRLPSMAYDVVAERILLFGGADAAGGVPVTKNDTWTWDGTTWLQRTPATSPPAREAAGMAYDPVRARIVMFGGAGSNMPLVSLGDTWEWDGTNWTAMTPASSPPPRAHLTMSYDPGRRRVVLAGGRGDAGNLDDAWEWDGTNWTQLAPQGSPGPNIAMVYDNRMQRLISYGDANYSGVSDDTWGLEFSSPLAPGELCIVDGVDDDGDGLAGCADPDCWARCTPLCPPGVTCPATAPRCGDGTCDPLEDEAICPGDC